MKTGNDVIESNLACNINSAVFNIIISSYCKHCCNNVISNVSGIQLPLAFAAIYIMRQLNVMECNNFRSSIHPGVEVPSEVHSRYTRSLEAVYKSC